MRCFNFANSSHAHMSSKVLKRGKINRINKFKLKKVITSISIKNGISEVKSIAHFQEFPLGTVISSSLGSFEILSELAIGRCCEVYIGENVSSRERRAIKVFIRKQHYQGALLRELKFLSKLTPHSHIVNPKGYFQFEGRDVLVHELLSCTVKNVTTLHENRSPSGWLVNTFAIHIMRGLAHMHRNGIVHGDIKPHNVMWSGQEETFKLIDFGVSFSLSENMEHAIQSRAYQAPETVRWNHWIQLLAGRNRNPQSPAPPKPGPEADVWSAACIVGEILTGNKVFTFGWNGEKVEEALKVCLQGVEDKTPEFLSNIFSWLRRCLEEDPKRRLQAEEAESAPFLLNGVCERPSMFDLLILPTTVLRVLRLIKPEMDEDSISELVDLVIEKASSEMAPKEHILYNPNGSLYIVYDSVQHSESACETLKLCTIKGFTLIVSYFPKKFYDRSNFF